MRGRGFACGCERSILYDVQPWTCSPIGVVGAGDALLSLSITLRPIVRFVLSGEGYTAEPTAEGVSLATTRTVVASSVLILLVDYVLTAAFLK